MAYDPYVDPEQFAIQQALARAAALRQQPAPTPQGRMVGDRYIKAPVTAGLVPIVNGLVADNMEQKAVGQQQALTARQQEALGQWLKARPQAKTTYGASDAGPTMSTTEPTDQDTADWAAQGLKNPLARTLAGKVIEDDIIQEPIRREKAADKKANTELVNQRYDEDRKARAQLATENSKNRIDLLTQRISAEKENLGARMALQKQLADESNNLRRLQIESGVEQKGLDRDLKAQLAQAKAGGVPGGKPLGTSQQKNLIELGGHISRQQGFEDSFSDDMVGPMAYAAAEVGGTFINKDPARAKIAQWWRDFRSNDVIDRHSLFGAALTPTEERSWKQTTVSPLSSKEQVRDAIATRKRIAEDVFERTGAVYTAGSAADQVAAARAPAASSRKSALPRATGSSAARVDQPTGSFVGSAEQITDAINSIADPVERDNARRAYANQLTSGATPAAGGKTVKWGDLK